MKIYALLMMICLLAFPAVLADVSVSDVSLSIDDAVARSNPREEGSRTVLDDRSELRYVDFNFKVTANASAVTIASISPSLTAFSYDSISTSIGDGAKTIIGSSLPLTVPAGQTVTVSVKVLVPSNLDAIDSSFDDVKYTVPVTFAFATGSPIVASGSFYVENMLELDDVTVETSDESVDCDVDTGVSLDCDDEIEEIRPDDSPKLSFTINNNFDSDADLDFSDVDINIDSDNGDVEANDDSFSEDIDADDSVEVDVDFDIDNDLDDGDDATITIEAEVEDENGALHGFRKEITMEFQVPDYKIEISEFSISTNAVCAGGQATALVAIENLGSREQTNIRYVLRNDQLNLQKIVEGIKLDAEDDADNAYSQSVTFGIPSSARVGSYPVQLLTYYKDEDSNSATEMLTANVVVEACTNGQPSNTGNTGNTNPGTSNNANTNTGATNGSLVVVQPGNTVVPTAPASGVRAVADNDSSYIVGLSVVAIVLIIAVIVLVGALLRR